MRDNFAGDTDNSVVRNLTQVPDWTSATSFDGFVFPCSFARGVYRAHGRDGPLARSRGVAGMEKARQFAILAHAGQTRRYTGEPYFEHPRKRGGSSMQFRTGIRFFSLRLATRSGSFGWGAWRLDNGSEFD